MKDVNIVSSDPVIINVNMATSTKRGLELLRRVRAFAEEMQQVGLEVDVEGYLTVRVRAPEPAPEPEPGDA